MKKNKLPKWNLDEIYVGHNDPKIDKDLKKLSKLTNQFIDKWKGKIKDLSGKEISNCLKEYEKINEIMGLLSTHSSLSFASKWKMLKYLDITQRSLIIYRCCFQN